MLIAIIAALVCVAANAFFVATEFALAKARPTALEALAKSGDRQADRAHRLVQKLDAYLTATQLGITFASLGLGWLGEPAIARLVGPLLIYFGLSEALIHAVALSLSFAVITFLHIVLGELVPKSLAIQRPEAVSRWTAAPMQMFYFLTYPIQVFFNAITNGLLRLLGLQSAASAHSVLSAAEIKLIVSSAFADEGADATKREVVERVLTSVDQPVRTAMVPRVDMITLNMDDDFEQCLAKVRRHGFSRYPLVENGDPDKVLGYVYVKDLLIASTRSRYDLRALRRDLIFIPETRTVGDTLGDFQRSKIPIGIVVDEYGGTSGLVTLEDVVEEIVGDIQDETDIENPRKHTREDGTIVVDGSLPMRELQLEGLELPNSDEGDTVGGCVVAALERLAYPGDRVQLGNYEAIVEDVRRRRIERVAFRKILKEPSQPPGRTSSHPPKAQ